MAWKGSESDTDYRGIYLPPADLHWSLYGVPDQLDREETQEQYWELQRFLVLALKANPNVLECLYTPLVERVTPLGQELLQMRGSFLSRLVFQTYNGYVASQFKKMQADIRNQGRVKWKHVMHLIRLLISGVSVLRHGFVPVRMDEHREQLLAVRRGELPWEETEKWRLSLHAQFDQAVQHTKLPERPDYERANGLLIKARRLALRRGIAMMLESTVTLYRPVGQDELDLIRDSGWRRFPPRLHWQPIFYPVLTEDYAVKIARDWNTKDPNSGFAGFVLCFKVDKSDTSTNSSRMRSVAGNCKNIGFRRSNSTNSMPTSSASSRFSTSFVAKTERNGHEV